MTSIPKIILTSFCLIILYSCSNRDDETGIGNTEETLFELVPSSYSNINFRNQLDEGLNTNILMYEYFYNGGGVAVGDLNNDGALDLYFTSNMGPNKMYLNENVQNGNNITLQYKDITIGSGAEGRSGPWKTGVNMVDINGDNLLDIYLCHSGALPEAKRANELFINQGNDENGNPQFSEKAEEFGLASGAYSNQSYFFDYDLDGDLDMILLNHNPKNLPILSEAKTRQLNNIEDPLRGLRLYQQKDGKFIDVTSSSGIKSSALSYGLGVGISDINLDGWPDFYVSNDYAIPDFLYINQGNGKFKNELESSMGHTSQFSMGNDISDINQDGFPDIFTLDMLPEDNKRQKLLIAPDNYSKYDHNVRSGFYHQLMRNMLQLNNGNGTFSEIGQFSGISNTDWSWSALFADYDNDGMDDLFITNGYNRDYTNMDFINYMEDYVQEKGRLQRENVVEIIEKMPASDIQNYLFKGIGNFKFKNVTQEWGMTEISNSNGAAYADLDNDGDLDLVVNNINKEAFLYENKADQNYLDIDLKGYDLNSQGIGSRVVLYNGKGQISKEVFPARGYQSSVSPILHFGLGANENIDSLIVFWPNRKRSVAKDVKANQLFSMSYEEAVNGKSRNLDSINSPLFQDTKPPFEYSNMKLEYRDFDRQALLPFGISNSGPIIRSVDLDNDGLEDLFIGGQAGESAKIYLQNENGSFNFINNPDFELSRDAHDTDASFFDANQDGLLDLYIASGGYHRFNPNDAVLKDRMYINESNGNFRLLEDALPEMTMASNSVSANDINQDGLMDLFIGGAYIPGMFPESTHSSILINDGKGKYKDRTLEMEFPSALLSSVEDAKWADLNGDENKELIVIRGFGKVEVFTMRDGKFLNINNELFIPEISGIWNTLEIADLNQDGKPDLLLGNMGTNFQLKASNKQPLNLYYSDYDKNGSTDPILTHYIEGVSYPLPTRDELLNQLVSLRSKFTSYESYANANIDEVLGHLNRKDEKIKSVDQLRSGVLLSNSDREYEFNPFPDEAQFSSIYTMDTIDFNSDGHTDLLCFGNNDQMRLQLGKCDASYGLLLEGDGKGNFTYIDQKRSGLDIKGDVRSVARVGDTFLIGINGNSLKAKYLAKDK